MTYDEFLSYVAERAGLPGVEASECTIRAVLEVIGERLSWPIIQALAEDLPDALAVSLRRVIPHQVFNLAELHARVAARTQVRLGLAVEHTGVVCQVIAEAVSAGTLHRLREALPEPMSALFVPREPEELLEHVHLDPSRHTLAEGRPGSHHPLSEARPERAHSHSVMRADNPHEDTKLSSASGFTQEREGETLAAGHPGSSRPLSEGEE
ncbi:DUF2267 domain-containing protein [Vitiosangium sp. GDMCC 1.1324]|uniref:DUF2267 domain-containing protein n=1 Tax=Vitiosangium sp. (strain GDMCC 1.1324) TaxID=2138576 RepID=UPI000D3C744C|nr:DUF2267 domain-containing protein [Vitiosangium sp. GDMCC 1.1324]PTL76008.1 DUF2267 domain-containing protein [Vitiosangium sp. GDMCC 1.1324]